MSHTKLTLHHQGIENNLFGDLDLIEANWTFLQTSMTSGAFLAVCVCALWSVCVFCVLPESVRNACGSVYGG